MRFCHAIPPNDGVYRLKSVPDSADNTQTHKDGREDSQVKNGIVSAIGASHTEGLGDPVRSF
jgi:hypothetical protein